MGRNINGEDIHILFCDIPAAHQVALLTKASELVTPECKIFFSLKTQSIRQDTPEKIYEDVKNELEKHFTIVESQSLEPYHKKHYFFVLRKK